MPDDPTPLGDAMSHRFPDQKIPQSKPGTSDKMRAENPASRPGLPEHPEHMPADDEDEDGEHIDPIRLPGKPHAPERV